MKAPILILPCTLSLFTSTGFCNDSLEFTLTEMDISLLERWKQGELEGILRIEQGEKLPFTLTVEGSVLALRDPPEPFLVEALQRVYIKIDKSRGRDRMKDKRIEQKWIELETDAKVFTFIYNKLGVDVEQELVDIESAMNLLASIEEEVQFEENGEE